MNLRSRAALWIAGIAIIVLTNIAMLAGVAYNRSSQSSLLELTERELRTPVTWGLDNHSSGLRLQLQWRTLGARGDDVQPDFGSGDPDWLDADKLRELGFPVDQVLSAQYSGRPHSESMAREVLLVLEQNGPAARGQAATVQRWLRKQEAVAAANPQDQEANNRARSAGRRWQSEQEQASRLIVVDAGLDQSLLRRRYPDRDQYAVVRGQVWMAVSRGDFDKPDIRGVVSGLSVNRVNVPLSLRDVFEPAQGSNAASQGQRPRYRVSLAYGARLEPWIVAAQRID